jgi:hypothetical protein
MSDYTVQSGRAARWVATALSAALLTAACGGDKAKMTSHVEGIVTDVFGLPVEGATVSTTSRIIGDGAQTTTDANGYYHFGFEGLGTVSLIITAEGFARSQSSATVTDIPDVPGDFEANAVRNVTLYRKSSGIEGRITRSRGPRAPVANLPIRLQFTDSSIRDTSLTLSGVTDAEGYYRFTELPGGASVRLFLPAHDVDGDEVLDTAARTVNVALGHDTTITEDISLGDFDSPRAVWSNVNDSLVEPDSEILVFFSVPMENSSNRIDVDLEQRSPERFDVAQTATLSQDGLTLTVSPLAALTRGAQYYVSVSAYSASDPRRVSASYSFSVKQDATTLPAPTNLRLQEGTTIQHTTSSVPLVWTAVSGATQYNIYMRNDGVATTDWVLARTYSSSAQQEISYSASIPSELRPNGFPFRSGGTLSVAVSALVAGVEGPLSSSISVKDEDCPKLNSIGRQGESWDNSSGSAPKTVELRVDFSEPLDPDDRPTLDIAATGVDETAFDFQWTSDTRARFIGPIPAGIDGSGTVTVNASGMSDPSGNTVCEDQNEASTTVN